MNYIMHMPLVSLHDTSVTQLVGVSIEWRSYHYIIIVIKHPHAPMGPHMHRQSCDKHLDLGAGIMTTCLLLPQCACLFASRALA